MFQSTKQTLGLTGQNGENNNILESLWPYPILIVHKKHLSPLLKNAEKTPSSTLHLFSRQGFDEDSIRPIKNHHDSPGVYNVGPPR